MNTSEIKTVDDLEPLFPRIETPDGRFDLGMIRPWLDGKGNSWVSYKNQKGIPVSVQTDLKADFTQAEWAEIDMATNRSFKFRTKIIGKLIEDGLVREWDMLNPDKSKYFERMPVIHKDWKFKKDVLHRELELVRSKQCSFRSSGLMCVFELMGRSCGEAAEILLMTGNEQYKLDGLFNHPKAAEGSWTFPDAADWKSSSLVKAILDAKEKSQDRRYYGPWFVFHAGYGKVCLNRYLDDDYGPACNDTTLRDKIKQIDGIIGVYGCEYYQGRDIALVQATTDVVRMVIGIQPTTVFWEEQDDCRVYKTLTITVPQFHTDCLGNTGICILRARNERSSQDQA